MNTQQLALMKKDIHSITSNKRVLTVMLMVPFALTIVLPSVLVFCITLVPESTADFQKLLEMLPVSAEEQNQEQLLLGLVLNKIIPALFLMIPVMASSVMSAGSFVGEKEKHTLETLLYSPLSLKQLFQAKIMAGFTVGMLVSILSFAAMILVLEIELFFLTGSVLVPEMSWLVVLLLVAPAISLVAIAVTVRGSAKAQTMEEAQQCAVFLIFPILALVISQFTGILLVNAWILLGLGIVLAVLAAALMKGAEGKFTYERLLK